MVWPSNDNLLCVCVACRSCLIGEVLWVYCFTPLCLHRIGVESFTPADYYMILFLGQTAPYTTHPAPTVVFVEIRSSEELIAFGSCTCGPSNYFFAVCLGSGLLTAWSSRLTTLLGPYFDVLRILINNQHTRHKDVMLHTLSTWTG